MTEPRRLRRRAFLLGAGGLGVSLLWRSYGSWPGLQSSGIDRLAGLLRDEESARVVGRVYLGMFPAEASPGVLAARLAAQLPGGRKGLETAGEGRLRERVLRLIEEDFRALRIVELDGWVLARTEARLCALMALR